MASIHSFKEYLEKNFYNELSAAVDDYVQQYPGKMGGLSDIDYPDEAAVDDIHVRMTGVDDAPGDYISFSVVVEADLEVTSITHHYRESDSSNQWFKVQCTALLNNGLRNFSVEDVSIYSEYDKKKHQVLSNTLVPVIYSTELEKVAEDFLERYYKEALEVPMAIEPRELARRMGLTLVETHLSKSCTVFGQTCFKDGLLEYYDSESKLFKTMSVKQKTILIDPNVFFMRNLGSLNNTIVHECVHWDKHKKFFELQKLFNPEAASIRCQVTEGYKRKSKDRTDYDWMEWHASALAPRILMPETTTRVKVEELIKKNKQLLPEADCREIYESVIFELKEFFGVSTQAVKIRLMDLGYDEAQGVLTYVDDRYITNYAFEKGALKKGQTYTIGIVDAMIQSKSNLGFSELLQSGQFLYVDSHFCINDSKYINEDEDGIAYLSDYASMHIDECCLTFEIKKTNNPYFSVQYYKECVLYRDALVDVLLEVSYKNLPQNASVIERAETLEKESKASAGIIQQLPGTFGGSLTKLMELYDVTEESLEFDSQVSTRTIQRMKNEPGYKPKLKTIIAVCLGMHLHPMLSKDLIKKSSVQPSIGFYEDIAYELLLDSGWKKSIFEINEELRASTVTPFFKEGD